MKMALKTNFLTQAENLTRRVASVKQQSRAGSTRARKPISPRLE
jgi:hypothetical protein